jgi:1-Cys peroxiredoxin 6
MPLNLGDTFPNFTAETTSGTIDFYSWLEDKWGVLFSHPADFTPVCTTELGAVAKIAPEFTKRNAKIIALSCDPVTSHQEWIQDIKSYNKIPSDGFPYPIISDPDRELAIRFGMLDPVEKDKAGLPLTCRAVFIISPDKKLKLQILYPATTGRNFDEILRVLDSLQLTAYSKVATPANWMSGGDCMILPTVTNEDATRIFVKGFKTAEVPSKKPYIRITPQP